MKRRRRINPLTRLVMAFRVAAHGIESATMRAIAAREADGIPKTRIEKAHGGKAKMASIGRAIMRDLPNKQPEDLPQAAKDLRACADALNSSFHITSETYLGERRRRTA